MPIKAEVIWLQPKGQSDKQKFRDICYKALDDTAKVMEGLIEDITDTWDHDVDIVKTKPRVAMNAISVDVFTTDLIYFFLDYGTSVRYARLSNWVSKTRVNQYRSGPGRGSAHPTKQPQPGIEARNWTFMMNKEMEAYLSARLEYYINQYF